MPNSRENDFLNKITEIILENISNEQFGVSELANEIGMSRSNLLRKIKKLDNLSVSQFIRQVRLKEAMEMLKENSLTVSEISYKVGFGSTSYFIKCFHDLYGYPPGEVGKRDVNESDSVEAGQINSKPLGNQNSIERFWQELKRRKVVKVIIVYSSVSLVVLELLNILIKPLFLPEWLMTSVIVLLAIGLPIALVFSWIFDVTPTGLEVTQSINEKGEPGVDNSKNSILFKSLIGVLLVVVAVLVYPKIFNSNNQEILNSELEKSIAVLPFINDSNDATNVYIVNGLMESILNNLQKIENLRVVSRTSVEKYRKNQMTIAEIAKELNVSYLIEGSGQKIGDKIQLTVQLIEGPTDKHLWSEQYNRDAKDIFDLQREVSKIIADKIEVIITPEEEERINKVPTENLVAYDYFLQGVDLLYSDEQDIEEAINFLKKAIHEDNEFASAYAVVAIAYFYLDENKTEKKYADEINNYADKALLFDADLPQSLIAKALFHINNAEYKLALPFLEKALEYNPNSAIVINILSDFYARIDPNTEKYLEYALKGLQLDVASQDSIAASFNFLHVSNAFIQLGFVDEAEMYIDKSLAYYSENSYSEYVRAYILYARNRDLSETKELLIKVLNKDRTRLDVMQEVGKICYFMGDYEEAYIYYQKFDEIREAQNIAIYAGEDSKIGMTLLKLGRVEESKKFFDSYKAFVDNDTSIYKELAAAMYYSYLGETEKALDHLALFAEEDNIQYWILLFMKHDPIADNIKDLPEFKRIFKSIETKFWNKHKQINTSLREKAVL